MLPWRRLVHFGIVMTSSNGNIFPVTGLLCGNSPVNSPHKGQWRGALMFSLICACMDVWVNNRDAGHLRRLHNHYDVTIMIANARNKLAPIGNIASETDYVNVFVRHERKLNFWPISTLKSSELVSAKSSRNHELMPYKTTKPQADRRQHFNKRWQVKTSAKRTKTLGVVERTIPHTA